jgi:D-hydroxyproline dehydrogenase subunit beta
MLAYYRELFRLSGLIRCKLQMMRTEAMGADWKLGAHLAAGLTLRHYHSFQICPILRVLAARYDREMPEYGRYGIHVLASQNRRGEVTLGDPHEYDADITPFD